MAPPCSHATGRHTFPRNRYRAVRRPTDASWTPDAGFALYAWDAGYEGRVLAGVRSQGIDLSGMTRAEAAAALTDNDHLGQGRLVLRTPDGDVVLPYADLGRRREIVP